MLNYLVLALAGTSMVAAAPANMTEANAMKMGIIRSDMHDMNMTKRDMGDMMPSNRTNIVARQLLNTTSIGDDATGTLGGATGGLTDDFTGQPPLGGDLTGELGGAIGGGGELSGILDSVLAPGVGGLGRMQKTDGMSMEETQAMEEVEKTLTELRDELRAMGM